MIGLPWFILAGGIFLVIIGALLASLMKPPESERFIDPQMRNDEIIRKLKSAERVSVSSLVILLGFLCILVSVVWRIVLMVASAIDSAKQG